MTVSLRGTEKEAIMMKKTYDIAAYIRPAYTGKELRTRVFLPDDLYGYGYLEAIRRVFLEETSE